MGVGRTPQGVRGLKCQGFDALCRDSYRTPQGVRGLVKRASAHVLPSSNIPK